MVIAAIGAGAAVASAGASIMGASKAGSAAEKAAQQQMDMFEQNKQTLAPFVQTGVNALQDAYGVARGGPTGGGPDYVSMAYSNLPGRMTQAELEATPGYQFTLAQGLKSTQSAAAARGLGVSGAALKGAAEYATGTANKTYLDQFNVRQQQFTDYLNLNTGQQGNLQNQYNRLADIAKIGQASAAGQATAGTSAANAAGNYINQSGLASAAGLTGASNALTGGVNNYLAYNAMQKALNPTTTGYNTPTNNINSSFTNPAEQAYYSAASSGQNYAYNG